jgi:nucleoside-diphosphate-sugar epimerase
MKVLFTGGAGFLGRRLAEQLLLRGSLTGPDGRDSRIDQLILLDIVPATGFSDPRVQVISGDISDPSLVRSVVDSETTSVFHLAAIVSGQAEMEFDLGIRINLDASRFLLEACRAHQRRPRVVFTSSGAVFGGSTLPKVVQDSTALNPQTSYGVQKAMVELLLSDYSRKGFVDGRALRMPTITVRPGKPNRAASSFVSGIIREPLNGQEGICPVPPGVHVWVLSPRAAIDNLIHAHELPTESLGDNRAVNVPGISVSVREMVDSLERIAGAEVASRVRWQIDPLIERIVAGWPGAWDGTRALALGFQSVTSFDDIVRAYIEDDLHPAGQSSPGSMGRVC